MSSSLYSITVDAHDPERLGRFWADVFGSTPTTDQDGDVYLPLVPGSTDGPFLLFLADPGEKQGKNRVHLDLQPHDRDEEVERLLGLGATHVDIGQGEQSWVVLADPEGNEFCVLAASE
jgi:hypothetical protein